MVIKGRIGEKFVFSLNQLKKDSMGCLILETAVENRSLKALFLCVTSIPRKSFRHEELPEICQFGLYTNELGNERSPRVFFFVGNFAIVYILFCVLHHSRCDSKKKLEQFSVKV